jgi:hypothetical protein
VTELAAAKLVEVDELLDDVCVPLEEIEVAVD